MTIDATFWVGISFILFFGGLVYLKVPQKINEILSKLITDIKNEINESEKLRSEATTLLNNSQAKLNSAQEESKKITEQAFAKTKVKNNKDINLDEDDFVNREVKIMYSEKF